MLVLQDCPICYEEFDEGVKPQVVHCVIGALTDSESEAERALWMALKDMTSIDHASRDQFLNDHPVDSLKEERMSEYIQIATSILILLVRTERENLELKTKMTQAEELRNKLTMDNIILEANLRKAELKAQTRPFRIRPLPCIPQTEAAVGIETTAHSPSNPQTLKTFELLSENRAASRFNTHSRHQGRSRYESRIPVEFDSKPITRDDHERFARRNPERDMNGNLIRYPTIAVAIRSYVSEQENELSLIVGEWLDLFPDTDLSSRREWIWCGKQDGTVGYVPRRCLFVRSIVES
ncbi:hypothetical protein RhiTH_009828 [Rhizoctonia solani]